MLHRAKEVLLLVLPREELLSEALKLKDFFDMNVKEESLRGTWLERVNKIVKKIDEHTDPDDTEREVLKDAMSILYNYYVDASFFKDYLTRFFLALNGVIMILAGVILLVFQLRFPVTSADFSTAFPFFVALIGFIGALTDNIIKIREKRSPIVPTMMVIRGSFYIPILNMIATRGGLGAVSAIFIVLLERSGLVFSLPNNGMAGYAVLAFASGFLATRFLTSAIESLLGKFEREADKSVKTSEEKY
jgi:hypothetical protein